MTDGERAAEAIRNATAAIAQCTASFTEAAAALGKLAMAGMSMEEILQRTSAKETNNWRKMHGLPMRRKGGGRRGSNRNL